MTLPHSSAWRLHPAEHARRSLPFIPDHASSQLPRSLHAHGLLYSLPRHLEPSSRLQRRQHILSPQQPGPYPWDTPNRFLSWGYLPFFNLPIIHRLELAYSHGGPHRIPLQRSHRSTATHRQTGRHRFPEYFSLNIQLEKRFHFLGYYLALRGGFDNITGRCNPYVVNGLIDPTIPSPPSAPAKAEPSPPGSASGPKMRV